MPSTLREKINGEPACNFVTKTTCSVVGTQKRDLIQVLGICFVSYNLYYLYISLFYMKCSSLLGYIAVLLQQISLVEMMPRSCAADLNGADPFSGNLGGAESLRRAVDISPN